MNIVIPSVFALLAFSGTAAAQNLPEQITCVYSSFQGNGVVSQELNLIDKGYISDTGLKYEVVGSTDVAFHLVHAAGGAISTIAIEAIDGSMLKVSSATFGTVSWERGHCK